MSDAPSTFNTSQPYSTPSDRKYSMFVQNKNILTLHFFPNVSVFWMNSQHVVCLLMLRTINVNLHFTGSKTSLFAGSGKKK